MPLTVGLKGRRETVVDNTNTAAAMGSGGAEVFATPMMISLMEGAAVEAILPYLAEGEGSVGTSISITHDAATPVGMKVWAEAELVAVDRKALTFAVTAYDDEGVVGKGEHHRFIINNEKFLAKVALKKPK